MGKSQQAKKEESVQPEVVQTPPERLSPYLPVIPDDRPIHKRVTICYDGNGGVYSYAMAWYMAYHMKASRPRMIGISHGGVPDFDYMGRLIIFVDGVLPFYTLGHMALTADLLFIGQDIDKRVDLAHMPIVGMSSWAEWKERFGNSNHNGRGSLSVVKGDHPTWKQITNFFGQSPEDFDSKIFDHLYTYHTSGGMGEAEICAAIEELEWKSIVPVNYEQLFTDTVGSNRHQDIGVCARRAVKSQLIDQCLRSQEQLIHIDTSIGYPVTVCQTIPQLSVAVARRLSNEKTTKGVGLSYYDDRYGRHFTVVVRPNTGMSARLIAERFGGTGDDYVARFTKPHNWRG